MFSAIIESTGLSTSTADRYLSTVRCDGVAFGTKTDRSMTSTLRALLYPREGSLDYYYRNRAFSNETIKANSVSEVIKAMIPSIDDNSFYLHEFCLKEDEDIMANMAVVKSEFMKKHRGWEKQDNVTAFFTGKCEVLCFINRKKRSVYMFTSRLNARLYHYLQCSIPAILPWYFDEKKLTEEELELMHSLTEQSEEKYLSLINKFALALDFRTLNIKKGLADFEKRIIRNGMTKIQRDIDNVDRRIKDYSDNMRSAIQERNQYVATLSGYELKLNGDDLDTELMNYFLCNKKLVLNSTDGDYIYFGVKDYLSYYDEEAAKAYINNSRSYIYNDYRGNISKEDMKKLMTAIFIDKKLKVRFCSRFKFKVCEFLEPARHADFSDPEFDGYSPNPHLDRYQCLGDNRTYINEALIANDTIMAIEQCVASNKCLNFRDSAVCSIFMSTMYENSSEDYNLKFIELPDGKVVKPSEAVKWLYEQEEEKKDE